MPVPEPDNDMLMPAAAPTTPVATDLPALPDWGEWLASAMFADEIAKLGTRVYFVSKY